MDLFKFHNPTAPTKMEQGEIINGLTSKTWIERYRDPGEFTLKAPVSSGVRDILPLDTFISHVDTEEVMIVENHEINEDEQNEPEITITGRSYETYLEQRIIGINNIFPMSFTDLHLNLASDYTPQQAVNLINDLIGDPLDLPNDTLPYVSVIHTVPSTGLLAPIARSINRGELHSALIDLLKIDNLGIKTIRPNPSSPLTSASPNVAFVIHKGADKTKQVAFSYSTGEIVNADYLWSTKRVKNAALISGRYVTTVVTAGVTSGFARRWMFVDASDIDQGLPGPPDVSTTPSIYTISAQMQQRGLDVLKSQVAIALTKAQVSREGTRAVFRTDYDLGDLITVHGDYDTAAAMRVTEYAEVEDDTGSSGYPTLSIDGG
jgi:hypothetical protein